ncbi:unnamed protein product, partial [marine sediment metagenome]
MKHSQNFRKIVLCIFLALFFIAGCAKKEKISSQAKLRLAFYGDIRNKPFGEALIEAFQKEHPSVQIKPIFIVSGYAQKLLTMIAGGDTPDLMIVGPLMMVDFVSKGILLNLQPYIDKDKEFQCFKDDIHPGSLEGSKYKGIYYSVPFWTNSLVLFYNKDLFDKEGLKYPDESWDWDKLLSEGKRLTKDINDDGKIDQYGFFGSFSLSDTSGGLYQYIRRNGGRLFNEDMTKCLIDSPESIEAIRWCFDLINKYKITPSPFAGDERLRDYEQAFLSGRVVMTISGRWSIPWFNKAKFNWSCAPQPKGKVEFKPSGVTLLGVYSKTKYPEECWEFLKFMMGKESQEIVCNLKA